MSYKDIIVYLDASDLNEPRVETAIKIAAQHKAKLTGVDISTAAAFEGERREQVQAIQRMFENMVRRAGLEAEYRLAGPSAKTAQELFSHCADLIVASQPGPDSAHLASAAVPKNVLLASGVPMLILPAAWEARQPIGRSILLAWNFSRESTRALHDSMPILIKAENIALFVFDASFHPHRSDVLDVVAHLERHGVKVKVDGWRGTGEVDVISAMFACLDREEADLIVAGAYGHSPLLESLFGGVSEQLLNNVSMPVVMSH
ncbi:universal stress protein [Phyllobacterium zundukense]|uniref:Universal stress protein n=1 Tax=Phyllobacterium zundukense TaxID=1867719 RepID=A0ACD4CX82_9HYPH|nr:universal stress protein [Phyllobacterium zundukense]UXN58212.1 universal stress protein [Phyllobacterium zundukense]